MWKMNSKVKAATSPPANADHLLPAEIWLHCFHFITPLSLCFSVAPTCRTFSHLSEDNTLWAPFVHPTWELGHSETHSPSVHHETTWKSLWLAWIRQQSRRYHEENENKKKQQQRPFPLVYYDHLLKVRLVGDFNTGKTSIMYRYGVRKLNIAMGALTLKAYQ